MDLYREIVVISVKNFSGLVTISGDGSWVCENGKHKAQHFPDPVSGILKFASLSARKLTAFYGCKDCFKKSLLLLSA